MKFNRESLILCAYIALAALFFLFPASLINFSQNDDWVYKLNTAQFLHGNFKLNPYIGPTFVLQGILGAIFSYFFGLARLPVLTGLMTIFSLILTVYILKTEFKLNTPDNILLSSLIAFSPLFVYSSLGFMTEMYYMPFFLVSLISALKYVKTKSAETLAILVLVTFAGLNIRQVSLAFPLSVFLYLLYTKNLKNAFYSLVWFALFLFYEQKIFPKTSRMIEVPLQFHHFLEFNHLFAIVFGSLLMTTAYILPLVYIALRNFIAEITAKRKYFTLILSIILFVVLIIAGRHLYKPRSISWGEFPYFENTFERTGFYPRGIHGTKYQFIGNYKLYKYWDLGAWMLLPGFAAFLISLKKLKLNLLAFIIIVYIGMLVATETMYDRYLIPLFPLFVFYILSLNIKLNRLDRLIVGCFAAVMIFLSYNFTMDFILVNRYAWSKSKEIVKSADVEPNEIFGTNAWKLENRNPNRDYKFLISYDSQSVNQDIKSLYTLYDQKEIKYPFSIFINPKIYIYRLK